MRKQQWAALMALLAVVVSIHTAPQLHHSQSSWQQHEHHPVDKRPRAIFHVGPHKTGTTSIQSVLQPRSKLYSNVTQVNNYHHVFIKAYPISSWIGGKRNSTVLKHLKRTRFLEHMTKHAAQGRNAIVSNEFLGQVHVQNHFVWEKFHEVLDLYDTTVVVAYRRLFEWSLSYYHQMVGYRVGRGKGLPGFAEELDMQMRQAGKIVKNSESPFLVFGGDEFAVHPSMNEKLRYENKGFAVDVFNFHSGPDVVAEFYCKYFGEESHTCLELRIKSTEEKIHENQRSFVWEYSRLAHAFLTRMDFGDLTRQNEFEKAIQHRQEKELNQTTSDFPKTCMSRKLADRFLNVSLALEEEMMPEFYASPRGQQEHREHFEAYFESDQFCNVDVAKVLEDPSWQEYMTAIFNAPK